MNDPLLLPCPTCSGTRTTTTGDRHAETVMDVCGTCQDTGTIPARPGETPEASYRPAATERAVPYYAEGGTVRKASIRTPNGDGSCTITLDFPVCRMAPECGDEAAVTVAALMNMGDAAQRATAERDRAIAIGQLDSRVSAALTAWNHVQSTATIDEDQADTDFGAMMYAVLAADDVIPGAAALPAAPGIYGAVLAFGAAARNAKHDADGEAHVMRHLRVLLDAIAARTGGTAAGLRLSDLQAANIARQAEWCPDQVPDLSFRGDVIICADLCAVTAGIDLEAAVVAKFNATSDKVGISVRLPTALTGSGDRS